MGRNPTKLTSWGWDPFILLFDRLENTSKSWEPPWDFSHQHLQGTNMSPFKGTFWRWCSELPMVGYVSFLEGKYV